MTDLAFAQPQFAHALWLVLGVTAALIYAELRSNSLLDRFIGKSMQARLVERPGDWRRGLRIALLSLSMISIVIAAMRPQWGFEFIESPQVGAEIMVALDVSRSMLAEDVAPNRLERAKAELRDLLPYLAGDQVGLIAFAGRASVLCPLTPDFGFLRVVLDNVDVGSVSRGGTRLEEPIRKATREDWGGHPVNIRLNIPLLFKRGYVTMVAGVCKRDPERREQDREVHPLRTIGNILFVGGCAALIYLVVIAAILFYSSAIDF